MKLHYSQTLVAMDVVIENMKLHYSQTTILCNDTCLMFDYHMKLHYSQTSGI